MAAHDDEKILARLLRRNLRGGASASGADCPGPDVLAAYYERSLDAPETARWEIHFSSCAHCREQLAGLTRSEAPAERAARPKWLWSWGILAPAAAALAILLALAIVRPWHKVATRTEPTPQVATTTPPASPSDETKELAKNTAPAPVKVPHEKNVRKAPLASGAAGVDRSVGAGVAGGMSATSPGAVKPSQKAAPATIAKANPKPAQPEAQEQDELATSAASAQVAQTPAAPSRPASAPAPLGSTPATAMSSRVSKQREEAQNSHRSSAAVRGGAQADALGRLRTLDTRSLEVRIPTPDRSVIWRAGEAGLVERSEDGGKTWKGQITSASADLLAGSAPAPNVCWVVGRGGTILLTTDGENWRKINSPTDADLVGIHATNAKKATVEASDGTRFVTEDGGVTWRAK
jgi:hypothetical protein